MTTAPSTSPIDASAGRLDPRTLSGDAHGLDPIEHLRAVMHVLRAPGGCPWDAEQTHESLIPSLIEEAYEVAEAIREGEAEQICEELGDLLLQPIFHAEIASERGDFDFDAVARAISAKLIRRHPHVFGEGEASDSGAVLRQWDEIKRQEKGDDRKAEDVPYLEKAHEGLPALMSAQKIQRKVARVGFDWPDASSVFDKVQEELGEVNEAMRAVEGHPDGEGSEAVAEELGDLLFAVVNLVRKQGLDAETVLASANGKFVRRFQTMERHLRKEQALSLEEADLDLMEAAWQAAKRETGLAC